MPLFDHKENGILGKNSVIRSVLRDKPEMKVLALQGA